MNLDDLIRLMSDFLRKFSVDHFAFGAVAMNFWIPPRFTHDLDLVLCIKKGALPQLVKRIRTILAEEAGGVIIKENIGEQWCSCSFSWCGT